MTENKQLITNKYRGLLRAGKDLFSKEDLKLIRQAFTIASEIHKNSFRENGDPFLLHPLAVARIALENMGLDTKSVLAAILHEAIKSGNIEKEEIISSFGLNVSEILEGLSKIAELGHTNDELQAENFRNLLLAISNDIRVILLKIADRYELMQSLEHLPKEKQIKKSIETFYLYAPLAHRLGLYNIKSELEDLSLKYTEPDTYNEIVQKLAETKQKRSKYIRDFIQPIKEELDKKKFNYEIKGRTKSVYSIWQKMKSQKVSFEEVYDVFAIRIILDVPPKKEKEDCWRAYSIVTDHYLPNPKRMRDWISVPKSTGYESLHTTVIGPKDRWVEVQIRTKRMDEIAEKGFAAHWRYKGQKQEEDLDLWLNKIREIIENPDENQSQLIDNFKLQLYQKEVYAFTPKGDLRKFPSGATVLDFAFDIHTEVGSKCVGAKINNKNVSIKHSLQNGDIVHIQTSKNQKPRQEWLSFVKTSKAINKIKQTLKEEELKAAGEGKELFMRRLKNWKIPYNEELANKLRLHYKYPRLIDFYNAIAEEKVSINQLKELSQKIQEGSYDKPNINEENPKETKELSTYSDNFLLIDEKQINIDYRLAKCCQPVHGDDIFGFVTIGEGIKIHRFDCPNALQLLTKYEYRVVKAKWKGLEELGSFKTRIRIVGKEEVGIINELMELISSKLNLTLRGIHIDEDDKKFSGNIDLFVANTKQLNLLLHKLQEIKGIEKAERIG